MTTEPGDGEREVLDLRRLLDVLKRNRWLIVGTTVVVVALAVGVSFTRGKQYRASTEVLLQERPSESVLNGDQVQNPLYLQQLVQTEIQVMRSRSVTSAAAKALGYPPAVSIAAKGQTQVVVISAEDPSPARAQKEADTFARTYIAERRRATIDDLDRAVFGLQAQLRDLERNLDRQRGTVADLQVQADAAPGDPALATRLAQARADLQSQEETVANRRVSLSEQIDQLQTTATLARSRGAQIVSEARRPTQPVSPNPKRDAAIALFLGLLLGVGVAFVREHVDDTIRSKDRLDLVTGGLPVLGTIPVVTGWKERDRPRLESLDAPSSPASEAYRSLRTSLQFIGLDREVGLVQITSSSESEGKTTTASNLAVALARAGKKVLLVDCDLRRPRVHAFFDLDNAVGFTSVLLGTAAPAQALHPIDDVPGLVVLPAGPPPPNPSELLASKRTRDALTSLAKEVDQVIIDSPPVLPVADSVVLAGVVDATVVVATAGATTGRSLGRALELLGNVAATVVGVVLNGVKEDAAYGYGYGYAPRDTPASPSSGKPDRPEAQLVP